MNKKFKSIPFFLGIILSVLIMTSCSDEKSTHYISAGEMSTNFSANLYLQMAVKGYVETQSDELLTQVITNSEAKTKFESSCAKILAQAKALNLPILEDSWIILELHDATGVVATEKLIFN